MLHRILQIFQESVAIKENDEKVSIKIISGKFEKDVECNRVGHPEHAESFANKFDEPEK